MTSTDVNDPPSNLALPTPFLVENSAERVLISPIILTDQDGNLPSCTLEDSAGGRVKVVGTNLVAGPNVTDYESLPAPQQITITLNCSDGHGMFIWKSFIINVTSKFLDSGIQLNLDLTKLRGTVEFGSLYWGFMILKTLL